MGPRASLDKCGKFRPTPGFDSRTVKPVASRYIDYATRPTLLKGVLRKFGYSHGVSQMLKCLKIAGLSYDTLAV